MKLKAISHEAIPRALELAERYRLLNEPEQAESICRDVLAADPNNQVATRILLLCFGDQFSASHSNSVQDAQQIATNLVDDYERHYYLGVVLERYARSVIRENQPASLAADWIEMAMKEFERAEAIRPAHDDAAILRWNTCARLLERLPKPDQPEQVAEAFDYA
jgi:hypothetical protein